MGINYDTVGDFYTALSDGLKAMVAQYGEAVAFAGDPALQLSQNEINMAGCKPVICSNCVRRSTPLWFRGGRSSGLG